jgi:hypothetical protein
MGEMKSVGHLATVRNLLSCPGIRMIFERARKEAPCILVLEDLDSLITDNNRSFFLNEVDGLEDNDGLLLVSFERAYGTDGRDWHDKLL